MFHLSFRYLPKIAAIGVGSLFAFKEYSYRSAACATLEVDQSKIPTVSRSVPGALPKQDFQLTVFQYQTCPFCSKVRAYLDYYGISYDVIEVNPLFRTETKFSPYRKVPFVLFGDKSSSNGPRLLLPDSSLIASVLQTSLLSGKTSKAEISKLLDSYPEIEVTRHGKPQKDFANKYFVMHGKDIGTESAADERKEVAWREWVDNTLVHTMAPNIYQTPGEAVDTFKYLAEAGDWNRLFPAWQVPVVIYVGAGIMYIIGKRLKKRHGLKDDVRISLYDACDEWVKALGKKNFMGGDRPNLADLGAYGVLSSIEGCRAFADVMSNTGIGPWFKRMKREVASRNGAKLLAA